MKHFTKNILHALLLATFSVSSFATLASQANIYQIEHHPEVSEHRGGNGGDRVAADFVQIANNILSSWKTLCHIYPHHTCSKLNAVEMLLDPNSPNFVIVRSHSEVYAHDDKLRDAVNYRENSQAFIVVNRQRWDDFVLTEYSALNRLILVLHEYLSLVGIEESDDYHTSREIIQAIEDIKMDLVKIASNRSIPDHCSLKINTHGYLKHETLKSLKGHLSRKGYKLIQINGKETRFSMTLALACNRIAHSTSCSIYTSIKDNYVNGSDYYFKHIVLPLYRETQEQALKRSFHEIYGELSECR